MSLSKKQKEHFHQTLQKLSSCLNTDPTALELIVSLQERISRMPLSKKIQTSPQGKEKEFPLPPQMVEDYSFALFSDGACRGNPGPGAWGSLGQNSQGQLIFESNGVDASTTNNRMEMTGAHEALKALERHLTTTSPPLTPHKVHVFLYSDSKYLVNGMNLWIQGWKSRGWKKSDKKPVENQALWQKLDELAGRFEKVLFYWVRGHDGHPQNEYCDSLANRALDESGF